VRRQPAVQAGQALFAPHEPEALREPAVLDLPVLRRRLAQTRADDLEERKERNQKCCLIQDR
jgi:hypothetical protein